MSTLCTRSRSIALAVAVLAAAAGGSARADARDEVIAAHRATSAAGKFRIRSEVETGSKKMSQSVEVQLPDRFHVKSEQMEAIIVPGGSYMRPGGQWMRSPVDMSQMIQQYTEEGRKQGQDSITNVQDLGAESVDGKAAHVYSYDASGQAMGVKSTAHVKIWVDGADQRILQMVVDGEAMGHKSKTTQHYEYDPTIAIVAPN
jgi:hypothetical protein